VKRIFRKTNAGLSVVTGGEAPDVFKKAEAFRFMSGSTPNAQTQLVPLHFIGWQVGSFSDSDLGKTHLQVRIS
jgi:hypothetical protein